VVQEDVIVLSPDRLKAIPGGIEPQLCSMYESKETTEDRNCWISSDNITHVTLCLPIRSLSSSERIFLSRLPTTQRAAFVVDRKAVKPLKAAQGNFNGGRSVGKKKKPKLKAPKI
jgi:hypothetical protein